MAEGGAALCLNGQGGRNSEALVRLTEEHSDLGLQRHRHHTETPYAEVYKTVSEDFLNSAGGISSEVGQFVCRGSHSWPQVMKCWPSLNRIVPLLGGSKTSYLLPTQGGRATRDAFVSLSWEEYDQSALRKDKNLLGITYLLTHQKHSS